jgi:uncharacterized protein DUF2848
VLEHWDRLELRAWSDGELYQEATLSSMLPPDAILAAVPADRLGAAAVVMCGTVPTVDGRFRFGRRFECALRDPVSGRELRTSYEIRALAPI